MALVELTIFGIPLILFSAAMLGFFTAYGVGANDVANAMGTSVGSKVLTISQAVLIAAIFEFLGAFFAGGDGPPGSAVATTEEWNAPTTSTVTFTAS